MYVPIDGWIWLFGLQMVLTRENRDVCAVTAEKGVCSGSGASMAVGRARNAEERYMDQVNFKGMSLRFLF